MRLLSLLILLVACATSDARSTDPFEDFLSAPGPIADRIDPPSGKRAVADGRVTASAGGEVTIEHLYYENHHRRVATSRHRASARKGAKVGAKVRRGDEVGALIATDAPPGTYFVPQREATLVLVDTTRFRARLYRGGEMSAEFEIGQGQAAGCKERRGDNKTPCGMYFIVAKHQPPDDGGTSSYFGGHWMKWSYPNAFDADRGLADGLITEKQAAAIRAAWADRKLTPQDTKLGSGIGFHGWAEEWEGPAFRGSWGCVMFHQREVAGVYAKLPVGAMVIAF